RGWQPAQPNSTARTPLPPFSFGPPVPVPVPRQPRISQPALHSIGTAHFITLPHGRRPRCTTCTPPQGWYASVAVLYVVHRRAKEPKKKAGEWRSWGDE